MKTSLLATVATLGVAALVLFTQEPQRIAPPPLPSPPASAAGNAVLGRLPVAFVPNLGQWDARARYVTRVGGMTVFLEEKGWSFTLVQHGTTADRESVAARGAAVRMAFAGAHHPALVPEGQLAGRHNYFLGNDPSRWRRDVPLYRSVLYRNMGPGVDVRAREHDRRFEYDLLLQPDADLDAVEIGVEGAQRMRLDGDGALMLETQAGPVRMPIPLCWEEGPSGERSPVACGYVMRGKDRFGFEVHGRRSGWALVVDPGLVWSTFLGGGGSDSAAALALDRQGGAFVAGTTYSPDFPTTLGAFDKTYHGGGFSGGDAFVTRLSPDGSSLVYSTFLGGTGTIPEAATALAIDAQGAATVAGVTMSTDFPITPGAFDTTPNGGADGFVTRLSPTGSTLVYSTFLGGTGGDDAKAVALDAQGTATIAGYTSSSNFPATSAAYDTTHNGANDAYVARLSPTGATLVYATFLGGAGADQANALTLDSQGAAVVVGNTASNGFPTTSGAFDTSYGGGATDGFVARLSASGASLDYSTFLGDTGSDAANAVGLDALSAATITGSTTSASFPTTAGCFDSSLNGSGDVFVARLSPTGSTLVYSTFLGGSGSDTGAGLALDAQGAATVAGSTSSSNFPTTPGAFDRTFGGAVFGDAFVTRLSATGSSLIYSTFLGGTPNIVVPIPRQGASAIALDALGAATVAGYTECIDFPTTAGAFSRVLNRYSLPLPSTDAFITRLDMLPTGVTAFGSSSPGCSGPLAISVSSMPSVGNAGFALTCSNAPPSTTGLLVLTAGRFQSPLNIFGLDWWLDPALVYLPFSASSNAAGAGTMPMPIPNKPNLAGARLFVQFAWLGPTSPPPCPRLGLSASNALDITIQP